VHGLNLIGHEKGDGIAKAPGCIRDGGNSGYQAVSLAILFGAARIVLLGFDMQATGRRLHWHADHGDGLANPVPQKFKDWSARFAQLAKLSPVEIINASRETALGCFPRIPLEEALG
jgi:hypothetical protein